LDLSALAPCLTEIDLTAERLAAVERLVAETGTWAAASAMVPFVA
jgi:hypothetical protein